MQSRHGLDDKVARYLRQQAELGGSEVVLGERAAKRLDVLFQVAADPAAVVVSAKREEPEAAAEPGLPSTPESSESPNRSIGQPSNWRKDAPPIPGPGMTVLPPETGRPGDGTALLATLEQVAETIRECRLCALCDGRTNTVPGEGNPQATLMCIGEGPGANEDAQGRPFVGAAGKLLDQILSAIECPRETVFIANIVKCRPPQNRKPLPDEAAACLPYLHRQIALVKPKVLLAMGGTAAEHLLGVKRSLGALRGQVHRYGEIPLIVTYHPAALLRNPNWKKPTWDDVRIARQLLEG